MRPALPRNVCTQCWCSLQQRAFLHVSTRNLRSQVQRKAPRPLHLERRFEPEKTSWLKKGVGFKQPVRPKTVHDVRVVLLDKLVPWSLSTSTVQRFEAFGIRKMQYSSAMIQFRKTVISELQRKDVDDNLKPSQAPRDPRWDYRMIYDELEKDTAKGVDRAFMRRFFLFCEEQTDLGLEHLLMVQDALGMQNPAELHGPARSARRKIIFHVGPTNSGKTYHALRALAASRVGVYAGPLRLLAFEIYDRLNKGLIPPSGADPGGVYSRPCNLVTGEEQRIDPDVTLSSSTIEMLSFNVKYDVAVIDEIQMIADEQRGSAWTNALLGLTADEIHVCGEETAVPLVQQLLADTGDEIIVNRYERLSPLQVAAQSMEGSCTDIRRGDCIVAFSRRDIFAYKHLIEQKTGLRCAVAYGKLPPEIRAEQALLFNKPNGDYPVMVASDAVGMGLNLNIKRVIFTTLHKWDGKSNILLTISQIKQIGGRAGRFGAHSHDSDATGFVTTMHDEDLPLLRLAMDSPLPALPSAYLAPNTFVLERLYTALPPQTGLETLYRLLMDLAVVREPYSLSNLAELLIPAGIIDKQCPDLPIRVRALLSQVPVDCRDHELMQAFQSMLKSLVDGLICDPAVLAGHFLGVLEEVETHQTAYNMNKEASDARIAGLQAEAERTPDGQDSLPLNQLPTTSLEASMRPDPPSMPLQAASSMLMKLEVLHKLLVAYAWLSFRFPMTFAMKESAGDLKNRTETAIEFCLECIRAMRKKARRGKINPQPQSILQPLKSFPDGRTSTDQPSL